MSKNALKNKKKREKKKAAEAAASGANNTWLNKSHSDVKIEWRLQFWDSRMVIKFLYRSGRKRYVNPCVSFLHFSCQLLTRQKQIEPKRRRKIRYERCFIMKEKMNVLVHIDFGTSVSVMCYKSVVL